MFRMVRPIAIQPVSLSLRLWGKPKIGVRHDPYVIRSTRDAWIWTVLWISVADVWWVCRFFLVGVS